MMERQCQNVRVDACRLRSAPRHPSCSCSRCGDRDAEHVIGWTFTGERLVEKVEELFCTSCLRESLGWDLEAVPTPALRGGCEYISVGRLNRLINRSPADYRASSLLAQA